MKNKIITISREFGSGGRTVGKEVAKKLGIPCYDQEIIKKIAQESGLTKDFVAEKGEYTARGGVFSSLFTDRSFQGISIQDYVWTVQRKIILDLAQKGPCVIVGRCADYILKDTADCLKVFIHADMDKRAERIVRLYGERDVEPVKRLKDKDKRRAAYYKLYTDLEWGEAKNYHLTLDTGFIGIEQSVDILAELYTHWGNGEQ